MDLRITDEANAWEPLPAQNITTIGLCIVPHDSGWVLRTATWGFKHPHYFEETFNLRSDRAPRELLPSVYQHESDTNPKGLAKIWTDGTWRRCWMLATAWQECKETKAEAKKYGRDASWLRMHLCGEPFLLAGVCGEREGSSGCPWE